MKLEQLSKQEVIKKFALSSKDVGSYPVQIAILTWEINHLTVHMKENKKDFHTLRGLKQKVNNRKKLIKKYMSEDSESCQKLVKKLAIRVAN